MTMDNVIYCCDSLTFCLLNIFYHLSSNWTGMCWDEHLYRGRLSGQLHNNNSRPQVKHKWGGYTIGAVQRDIVHL